MGVVVEPFDFFDNQRIDFQSAEVRRDLARVVAALFDRWKISNDEQLELLGLSKGSRKLLPKYRSGENPLPFQRDVLDRVSYLLGIHKGLRLLFPEDQDLRYTWVHRRHAVLEQATPLEVMLRQGLVGIARMARLVDFQRGR